MNTALMVLAQLWQLRRKVPLSLWLIAGLVVLLGVSRCERTRYGAREYDRGVADTKAGAQMDSMLRAQLVAKHDSAKAHTDTAVKHVQRARTRVDSAIAALSPTTSQLPEVANLVATVTQLTTQVDTLVRTLDRERTLGALRASVDSASIVSLRIIANAEAKRADQAERERDAKPGWPKVIGGAVVGAAVGVLVGVLR